MWLMRSKDGNNLVVDCKCGCDNGIRIRVDKEKKIWSIIRNKDYHYSDISPALSRRDYELL